MRGIQLEVWEVAGADFALRRKLWRPPHSLDEQRHRRIICLERQPATDTIRHEIVRHTHHLPLTATVRQQHVTAHIVPFSCHGNMLVVGGMFVLLTGAGTLMRLSDASSTRVRKELGRDGGREMVRAGWMSREVVEAMQGMHWRQEGSYGRHRRRSGA
mmetsp:Transcript_7576/g.21693  ORF Transcript_7576/g.21693 Transcript_7576/m.21693 type:complete len:158 (+) Transcript_7576:528-1001(+)